MKENTEFVQKIDNFTINCSVKDFSINFIIEEDKDNIKEIYKEKYFIHTLPQILQQSIDSVEELYFYILNNLPDSLKLANLRNSEEIIIRALIADRVREIPLKLDTYELNPVEQLKRKNMRMAITQERLQQELQEALRTINTLRMNESFNNDDYEKMRLKNKKLTTENLKLNSEKKTLVEENAALKKRLDTIKVELASNMEALSAREFSEQPNHSFLHSEHSENVQSINQAAFSENLSIHNQNQSSNQELQLSVESARTVKPGRPRKLNVPSEPSIYAQAKNDHGQKKNIYINQQPTVQVHSPVLSHNSSTKQSQKLSNMTKSNNANENFTNSIDGETIVNLEEDVGESLEQEAEEEVSIISVTKRKGVDCENGGHSAHEDSRSINLDDVSSIHSVSHAQSNALSVPRSNGTVSLHSRPVSMESQSLIANLERISELTSFEGSGITYSKKQRIQYKKIAKNQKEFAYFEDNVSHILKTETESANVFNFFVRKIDRLKLLYRASEHAFDIGIFHKKCDNVKNVILFVETEYGRKIGAYTPIPFANLKKPKFAEDPNCETFLFSVTRNQKYRLINPTKAHFDSLNHGPSFGRLNLHLIDRANLNQKNISLPLSDFENQFSTKEQAYINFTGSQNQNFKTLEWEVYEIEFVPG